MLRLQHLYAILAILVSRPGLAQIDADLTAWYGLRGGTVDNVLYLEGGRPSWGDNVPVNNEEGFLWRLEYCHPFSASNDRFSSFVTQLQETVDAGSLTFTGGALFTSKNGFYTYGGLAYPSARNDSAYIFQAEVKPTSPDAKAWAEIRNTHFELSGVTNYVAWGAGVSVPSESLGFYFGGVRSSSGGNISFEISDQEGYRDGATNLSDTLITVDLTNSRSPIWSNDSLTANDIDPRTGSSLVWIPTATKGLLVAIGGVPVSDDRHGPNTFLSTDDENLIRADSPAFMNEVSIYDVARKTWYRQKTSHIGNNSPPEILTQHCAVAVTRDYQTFQIYVYGGWNGIDTVNDEVWVLSLPSFIWIKAKESDISDHGRRGHICVAPTDNQLITIGGGDQYQLALKHSLIDVFDMNNLTWTHEYKPTTNEGYITPDVIQKQIYDGSQKPIFADGMDSSLASLFTDEYPNKKSLTKGYPFSSCGSTPGNNSDSNQNPKPSSPKWKTPVIAVLVVFGVLLLGAFLFWRYCRPAARRRQIRYAANGSRPRGLLSRFFNRKSPPEMIEEDKGEVSIVAREVASPMSPAQNTIYEVEAGDFGYFKSHEIDSDSSIQPHRSPQSTAVGSPGSANSPATEMDGSPRPRQEMSSVPVGMEDNYAIRNHPLYPRSIDGATRSSRSDSFPTPSDRGGRYPIIEGVSARAGPVSPYELPPNHSDEAVGIDPDSDFRLEGKHPRGGSVTAGSENDTIGTMNSSYPTDITPVRHRTVPPVSQYHYGHQRNTSSLNSNTPLLSGVNRVEEHDTSHYTDTRPLSPTSPASFASPTSHHNGQISPNGQEMPFPGPLVGQGPGSEAIPAEPPIAATSPTDSIRERKLIQRKSLPRETEVIAQQRRKSLNSTTSEGAQPQAEQIPTVASQVQDMRTMESPKTPQTKSAYELNRERSMR